MALRLSPNPVVGGLLSNRTRSDFDVSTASRCVESLALIRRRLASRCDSPASEPFPGNLKGCGDSDRYRDRSRSRLRSVCVGLERRCEHAVISLADVRLRQLHIWFHGIEYNVTHNDFCQHFVQHLVAFNLPDVDLLVGGDNERDLLINRDWFGFDNPDFRIELGYGIRSFDDVCNRQGQQQRVRH